MIEDLVRKLVSVIPMKKPKRYRDKYDTIGHQVLDLETEFGAADSDYGALDDLIDKVKDRIEFKEYAKGDAAQILGAIGDILHEKGFRYEEEHLLFNQGIKEKVLDGYKAAVIYLSIAQAIELPLVAVNVPRHTFVRWKQDGQYFNWETIIGSELGDEDYIRNRNLPQESIDNNIFLRELTNKEIIALEYIQRGIAWSERDDLKKAIRDFSRAIRLYPNSPLAHYNRGYAWGQKNKLNRALNDYNKAIELNPNFLDAYDERGDIWHRKNNTEKALEDFNRAIMLDPDSAATYNNRGRIWTQRGDINNALDDFNEAIRLNPNFPQAYFNRGSIWRYLGKSEKADADFAMARNLSNK